MIKRIIGVNIAVKDLNAAVKRYEEVLGIKPEYLKPDDFAFPGIKGAFFRLGNELVNLLTSEEPGNSITRFLETKGDGLFLIEFEVTDAEQDTRDLLKKGVEAGERRTIALCWRQGQLLPSQIHARRDDVLRPGRPGSRRHLLRVI